jgi:uncharacterized NAD(P)/FAD-binding protein YdhS
VVIVGGGFSGTCTGLNLAKRKESDHIRVTVIDSAEEVGPGLAYRFDDHNLLLNVPAGDMSAFADDPDDFLNFCRSVDPSFNSGSFVPRRLYGQYLRSHWA